MKEKEKWHKFQIAFELLTTYENAFPSKKEFNESIKDMYEEKNVKVQNIRLRKIKEPNVKVQNIRLRKIKEPEVSDSSEQSFIVMTFDSRGHRYEKSDETVRVVKANSLVEAMFLAGKLSGCISDEDINNYKRDLKESAQSKHKKIHKVDLNDINLQQKIVNHIFNDETSIEVYSLDGELIHKQ